MRGVPLDNPNGLTSECGIPICKLIRKYGEDVLEFFSVGVIVGAEEAYTRVPFFVTISANL